VAAVPWHGTLAYRRRTALLFQELLLDTTVFGNVALGLRLRGVPARAVAARVDAWLERLGIAHLACRAARTLSGGEARRVSLARAFVLEPEALFLDEPFAALDPPMRAAFVRDVARLLDERRPATVLVTHDCAEAATLADRVAVLLDGALAELGPTNVVLASPRDPRVAAFVRAGALPPRRGRAGAVCAMLSGSAEEERPCPGR
jgi:tungstate transport system ATP-binding protein